MAGRKLSLFQKEVWRDGKLSLFQKEVWWDGKLSLFQKEVWRDGKLSLFHRSCRHCTVGVNTNGTVAAFLVTVTRKLQALVYDCFLQPLPYLVTP